MKGMKRIACTCGSGNVKKWDWENPADYWTEKCSRCNGAGWLRLRDGVLERLTMEEVQADEPDEHEHEWVTRI